MKKENENVKKEDIEKTKNSKTESNDEVLKKKKLKEEISKNIDDNAIEELILLKQALDEKSEMLEKVSKERDDFKESLLRLKAEFENYKKRMRREKEEFAKYSTQKLIEDLLPILDNFDRAIASGNESEKDDPFFEGIKLIERSFYDLLEKKYNLKSVGKKGEKFNPIYHEAITIVEDKNSDGLSIEEVIQKGYILADRVIRTAKVVVRKGMKGANGGKKEKAEDSSKNSSTLDSTKKDNINNNDKNDNDSKEEIK